MNGINALKKWLHIIRKQHEGASSQPEEGTQQKATAVALILDVLAYRTINNKFLLFVSHTVSGILL